MLLRSLKHCLALLKKLLNAEDQLGRVGVVAEVEDLGGMPKRVQA